MSISPIPSEKSDWTSWKSPGGEISTGIACVCMCAVVIISPFWLLVYVVALLRDSITTKPAPAHLLHVSNWYIISILLTITLQSFRRHDFNSSDLPIFGPYSAFNESKHKSASLYFGTVYKIYRLYNIAGLNSILFIMDTSQGLTSTGCDVSCGLEGRTNHIGVDCEGGNQWAPASILAANEQTARQFWIANGR